MMSEICVISLLYSFNKIIIQAYKSAFPMTERKRKIKDIKRPYIDNVIKSVIKEKHKLQKRYYRHPITYNDEYKTNILAEFIANAKQRMYF